LSQEFCPSAARAEGTDVRRLQFYAGDQVLGGVGQAPGKRAWTNAAPGPHGVFAMRESAAGKRGVSSPALIVGKRA